MGKQPPKRPAKRAAPKVQKKPADKSRARAKPEPQNDAPGDGAGFVASLAADAERAAIKARIVALVEGGPNRAPLSFSGAAAKAGIARQTLYAWRDADPAFAAELLEAYNAGTDALKDEAARRAFDGANDLLWKMIQGRDPSWRDPKYPAPVQAPAVPEGSVILDVAQMSAEDRAAVKAILRKSMDSVAKNQPLAR